MPSNRRPPGEQPATPTSTNRVAPGPISTARVRAAGKDVTVAGPMSIGRLACSTAAPRARRDCRSYRRHWAQRHLGTPGHCNHGVDPPVARDARVGGWRRHNSVLLRVPSLNLIASALAETDRLTPFLTLLLRMTAEELGRLNLKLFLQREDLLPPVPEAPDSPLP